MTQLELISSESNASPNTTIGWLSELNPSQRKAVEASITQNVQVLAGAGTGKTKMLSHRAVYLAQQLLTENPNENPFDKLFIATFSEKAARHLRNSIGELWQKQTGQPLPEKPWIGTIHSLAYRILSAKQNKDASKNILNALDELTLQEEFIGLLLGAEIDDITSSLNIESSQAYLLEPEYWLDKGITDIEGLFTHIILQLIPQIKAAGLTPNEFKILAQTQSKHFFETLKTLPLNNKSSGLPFVDINEVVASWESHLKQHSASNWQLHPTQWDMEIEAQKAKTRKDTKPKTELNLLLSHFRKLSDKEKYLDYNARKKEFVFPATDYTFKLEQEILELELVLIELITLLYQGYQNLLSLENACDFDDILLDILSLDSRIILTYQKQFSHYLIDEFQDTNGAQLALIQRLSNNTTPITVVGDIKQSIYGFRYAQPENLNTIFKTRETCLQITLSDNYRSHADILKLANTVTHFLNLEPSIHHLQAKKESQADNQAPITWKVIDANQIHTALQAQNQFIQEKITELVETKQYTYKDMAILVPNHQFARDILDVLKAGNIPAIRQKSLGFFGDPGLLAISQWLQWLIEPDNNMALIGWLQFLLEPSDLIFFVEASMQQDKTQSYTNFLNLKLSNKPDTIENISRLIQQMQADFRNDLPHDALQKLLAHPHKNNFFPHVNFEALTLELQSLQVVLLHWAKAAKHIDINDKAAHAIRCLKRALSENELELPVMNDTEETHEAESMLNAVSILTTHAAKGLEFPVVFLAGVESYRKTRLSAGILQFEPQHTGKAGMGIMLNNYQNQETLKKRFYKTIWHTPQRLKESLNLLYVSYTRAKEKLIITTCPKSFDYLNPEFYL